MSRMPDPYARRRFLALSWRIVMFCMWRADAFQPQAVRIVACRLKIYQEAVATPAAFFHTPSVAIHECAHAGQLHVIAVCFGLIMFTVRQIEF